MRVICKILTMSTCCNGVTFFPLHNGAMVSEEIIDQDTLDRFLSIPGFEVYEPTVRTVGDDKKPTSPEGDPLIPIPGWETLANLGGDAPQIPNPEGDKAADPNQPPVVVATAEPADPSASASPNAGQANQSKPNQATQPKPRQAKPNQAKQPNKRS